MSLCRAQRDVQSKMWVMANLYYRGFVTTMTQAFQFHSLIVYLAQFPVFDRSFVDGYGAYGKII